MALYEHKEATLGDMNGSGYAFLRRTFEGDVYHGVFFAETEEGESLQSLIDGDEVEFSGTVYRKTRSGQMRASKKTVTVDVQHHVPVSVGERVDFVVVDGV
jgi:hypothetical protein